MKIYVVDNYDSFVYNIVHLVKELGITELRIGKNDQLDLDEIAGYDKIILSPGPGIPSEAGQMMAVIERFHKSHPILGVCLGHQAIGAFFGWPLRRLTEPLHGVASGMEILERSDLFHEIPEAITIGHYHSWVIDAIDETALQVLATDPDKNVMAIKHRQYPVYGLQFHPESVLTEQGKRILNNWLHI